MLRHNNEKSTVDSEHETMNSEQRTIKKHSQKIL